MFNNIMINNNIVIYVYLYIFIYIYIRYLYACVGMIWDLMGVEFS